MTIEELLSQFDTEESLTSLEAVGGKIAQDLWNMRTYFKNRFLVSEERDGLLRVIRSKHFDFVFSYYVQKKIQDDKELDPKNVCKGRAYAALAKRVDTVGELLDKFYTEDDLSEMAGIGKDSAKYIKLAIDYFREDLKNPSLLTVNSYEL